MAYILKHYQIMDYKVKLKQYSLRYISQQFITYHDEFKQLYILTYEISSKLEDDFLEMEIERALATTTLVTITDKDFIFLNNYILAFFCKKYIHHPIDRQLNCICVNNDESLKLHRLEIIFYELINILNRATRYQENLNYYNIHQELKTALTPKQCQYLFNLNSYTILLFCKHMNIHKNTYHNARNESKKEREI